MDRDEESNVHHRIIFMDSSSLMRSLLLHLVKKSSDGDKDEDAEKQMRKDFGYIDSSMTATISHIDGYTKKDNGHYGKISESEMQKIVKMPRAMKTCMVIMQRAIYDGYEICPGIESWNKNLKDIVMSKGEAKRYIVVRFESDKNNENPKLGMGHVATDSDKNTSLPRLFYAYRYAKQVLDINEYVLCTDGCFEDTIDNHELEEIEEYDPVLRLDDDNKNYKIRSSLIGKLKSLLKPHLSSVLADRILHCLLTNRVLEEDENSYFLKKEVIDMENKRLREEFLAGDHKSEYSTQLWDELNLRFRNMMLLGMPSVERSKINLAWDFGKSTDPNGGVYEKVQDSELKQFLDELTIATYMPTEKKINKYFASKIGCKSFDSDSYTKTIYWKNNMKRLIDLLTFGGKGFSNEEIRKIIKEDRENLSNWLPSAEPIRYLVGRNTLLKRINKKLQSGQILICTGMGGIGKSQLVNMYCKLYGKENVGDNIVWLHANDKEKLEMQFYDLTTNAMCIYDRRQADTKSWNEIMKEIIDYYNGKKWLIVYDDALPYILEKREEGQESFLPEKWIDEDYPHIIITSRKHTWNRGTVIDVPLLEEDESREAIVRNVDLVLNKQLAETGTTIAKVMGSFPMAVYQTITYINKRAMDKRNEGEQFTFDEFLEEFSQRPDRCFGYKQDNQNKTLYSNTILNVWNSALQEIQAESNGMKALEMFHLAAFLKNDEIPRNVFLDLVDNDEKELDELIAMLKERSMIEVLCDNILSIHKIFKLVLRIKIREPVKYGGDYKRPNTYNEAYEEAKKYFLDKTDVELIEHEGDYPRVSYDSE